MASNPHHGGDKKAAGCSVLFERRSLNTWLSRRGEQAAARRECMPPPARLASHSEGIEIAVTPYVIIILAAACAFGAGAFCRPKRVFMGSAIAAACALGGPYIIAYAATPWLGEGAGMGVAFILYAFSAVCFSRLWPPVSAPLPDTYGRPCVAESSQGVRRT
jgi:hypothetical protein